MVVKKKRWHISFEECTLILVTTVASTSQRDQQEQHATQEQPSSSALVTSQPTYYTADSSGIITIPIQQSSNLGALQANPVILFDFKMYPKFFTVVVSRLFSFSVIIRNVICFFLTFLYSFCSVFKPLLKLLVSFYLLFILLGF